MPRPANAKPSYCHSKTRNRAYMTLDGRYVDLGVYDSPESRDKYDRLVGEWIAQGRSRGLPVVDASAPLMVEQVIAGFWSHAQTIYPTPTPTKPGKRPAGELGNYWDAIRPLRRLYGSTPAASFGPKALMAVRSEMIRSRTVTDATTGVTRTLPGWCRSVANRNIGRIARIFRWAVENELLPGEVAYRLDAVEGLRRGRSEARETDKVKPVPDVYVRAILPFLSRQVKEMIELQLFTGMRPGEVCRMTTGEIDTTGKVWVYRPVKHKTAHHGIAREIRLGPRARAIVEPLLKPDLAAALFSPAEAIAAWNKARREARAAGGTPMTPSQAARQPVKHRRRGPGNRFTVASFRRAIARACDKADKVAHAADPSAPADLVLVPRWHPNQLRHNAGTKLRAAFGAEAAQLLLGHTKLSTTEIYAERDTATLNRIIEQVG